MLIRLFFFQFQIDYVSVRCSVPNDATSTPTHTRERGNLARFPGTTHPLPFAYAQNACENISKQTLHIVLFLILAVTSIQLSSISSNISKLLRLHELNIGENKVVYFFGIVGFLLLSLTIIFIIFFIHSYQTFPLR